MGIVTKKRAYAYALEHSLLTSGIVPLGHTANAAGAAAAPYNAAMMRGIGTRTLYDLQAAGKMKNAHQLQVNARVVAAQAHVYQAAGNTALASKLMAQAQAAMTQAQDMANQANALQATSAGITSSLQGFPLAASYAAARAAALSGPQYHVPPPMPL